jgi:hypothetical protein
MGFGSADFATALLKPWAAKETDVDLPITLSCRMGCRQ